MKVPITGVVFLCIVLLIGWLSGSAPVYAQGLPESPELGAELLTGDPFIELDGLTSAECRKPSIMPKMVEEAQAYLPCRQMKVVQHWLDAMLDERVFRATEAQLEPTPDDFDGELDLNDGDRRRQYFFGRYWDTHVLNNASTIGACDEECRNQAIEGFESDLRQVFQKLMAVLIASTTPSDRNDGGEDWWWELPTPYADVANLNLRAQMMRDDVNTWIQKSGLWVFADAGTGDQIDEGKVRGDFDFLLIEIVHFLYGLEDRPDLLYDSSIETLLRKGWGNPEFSEIGLLVPAGWTDSKIPFSGQDFERELWNGQNISIGFSHLDFSLAETENHVLMTLAHYYLINQWILNGYRGTPENLQELAPSDWNAEDWFAYQNVPLADVVRDVVSRPMHSGFFEDNARPYHGFSFQALLAFVRYAEDDVIRKEAENALHFAATKFAFQSLDGRRYTPMRRNCEYANELHIYNRDAAALGLGVLSGAYKWNDSPYGLKPSLSNPGVCFLQGNGATSDCYWPKYTWKDDRGEDENGNTLPPEERNSDDLGGEQIATTAEELRNDVPDSGALGRAIWTAFSGYELPRAVHDFMLNKYDGNKSVEQYDYLSRPYTILTEVPTVKGANEDDNAEDAGNILYYKPFDTGKTWTFDEVNQYLPFMRGDTDRWYKSANIATYKNFSYGYRINFKLEETVNSPLDWCFGVPVDYEKKDLDFPQELPESWLDENQVSTKEFGIGIARFRLYDLRDVLQNEGQTGFYLVTARVRKRSASPWSKKVGRGFWEVVPSHLFDNLDELEARVKEYNKPEGFSSRYTLKKHKHYTYRLATSGETVRLSQYYGAIFLNCQADADNEGRVQGIIDVKEPQGDGYSKSDVFVEFMDNNDMNNLPLIDVKAVNPDYSFTTDKNDNFVYYACARDGWLFVNNVVNGSYLFADSRHGSGFEDDPLLTTPYWVAGTFQDDQPWGALCGYGSGSGWEPAPPENGEPEQCSDPQLCEPEENRERPDLTVEILRIDEVCPTEDICEPRTLLEIKNIGTADAPAFNFQVRFDPEQSVTVNQVFANGLAAGDSFQTTIVGLTDSSCFDPSCTVCVIVDSEQQVEEIDESNNEVCQTKEQ